MNEHFTGRIPQQTLNLDLSRSIVRVASLSELCTDLFLIVIKMREAEDLGEPQALRKLVNHYLDLFDKNGAAAGFPSRQVERAKYALIALIDETVLSVPGACRDYWLGHPLQIDHFGDALAGETFYRYCEEISRDHSARTVLEVYYLCLSLGFEGKYRIAGGEERRNLMATLGGKLTEAEKDRVRSLSPNTEVQKSVAVKSSGRFSEALAVLPPVAAALLLLLLWLGLRIAAHLRLESLTL